MTIKRVIELWNYTKEGLGVIGEMAQGLITDAEAAARIQQLRRKYGIEDRG